MDRPSVEHLENELIDLRKGIVALRAEFVATRAENKLLKEQIARLSRGDLTPEEFQRLCHNYDELKPGCSREEFEEGCKRYQLKLFGPRKESSCEQVPNVREEGESIREVLQPCEQVV